MVKFTHITFSYDLSQTAGPKAGHPAGHAPGNPSSPPWRGCHWPCHVTKAAGDRGQRMACYAAD